MFIGIDPSFTGTGIVILDEDAQLSSQALLTSPATHTWQTRTRRIQRLRNLFLAELPLSCVRLVMEGYSYGSGWRSHFMGELGFCYREAILNKYGTDRTHIVPPTTVKKFVTGNGRSDKKIVRSSIEEQFGLVFRDLNLSDACAMALFSLALKNPEMFREEQREVVGRWLDKTSTPQISASGR